MLCRCRSVNCNSCTVIVDWYSTLRLAKCEIKLCLLVKHYRSSDRRRAVLPWRRRWCSYRRRVPVRWVAPPRRSAIFAPLSSRNARDVGTARCDVGTTWTTARSTPDTPLYETGSRTCWRGGHVTGNRSSPSLLCAWRHCPSWPLRIDAGGGRRSAGFRHQ